MVYYFVPDGFVFREKPLHVVRKWFKFQNFENFEFVLERVPDAPLPVKVPRRKAVRAWCIFG